MKIARDPGAAYKFGEEGRVLSTTFSEIQKQNQVQEGEPVHSFIHSLHEHLLGSCFPDGLHFGSV